VPRATSIRELLVRNQDFRRLWAAQLVSFLGDWFNTLAVYDLVTELSGGSGQALAWVLISRFVPTLVFSAAAGVAADRWSRKHILIVSDVLRALVVLGFLLIRRPDQLPFVYGLTALQLSLSAFFQPARDAAVPTITTRAELFAANALSGASWSAMLALGAGLGGLVTSGFGREAAFVIDALSYLFSAWLVRGVRIPKPRAKPVRRLDLAALTGAADIADGAAYVRRNPVVAWLLSVKLGWGLGGGVLLLLVVFGERIFAPGGPLGVGILYAARGLGSGIGPFLARRLGGESPRSMRRAISVAFLCAGGFYLAFSHAANLGTAVLMLVLAHIGGSVLWVFSTTLLQLAVPDRYRGRVFAAEWAFVTLSMSISSYLTGRALDIPGVDPRQIARLLGCAFLLPGVVWILGQRYLGGRLERHIEARHAEEEGETVAEPELA
jgi:MFS family permease